MTDNERHFDEDLDLKVSGKLGVDLNALFKPQLSVPPEVDRAVMNQARQRLLRRRPRRLLRWAVSVAAAAAVIIFVFTVELAKKEPGPVFSRLDHAVTPADIDQNGRVDILDAFRLARHIESTDRPETKWDINGDGLVNRNDVDSVAFAAVRLDKGVL